MPVPAVAVAGPVLTTATSAWVRTAVVAVALLLVGSGSVVVLLTSAVLLRVEPDARAGSTRTTRVKTAMPTAKLGLVELTVPVPPTAGVVEDQPPGAVKDTKVV